ncbi:MAG: phosphodiester glycosidase family protein [Candidatus Adiutrix intracellularis]|nr:phosphodiester glycosidase family protein [Candidatus Adiutrix intracellularis]
MVRLIYTMLSKIKISILIIVFLAACLSPAESLGEVFSENVALSEAIWRLAAFLPASRSLTRTLNIEGLLGLPPVRICLTFGEALDPWPESLSLTFTAEDGPPPVFFTLSDRRPFGGPNLELTGPRVVLAAETARTEDFFLNLLTRLNQRLLVGRPRLEALRWVEKAPGFEAAHTRLLFGARFGPDDLFLARFDPARYTFRPYHESEYPGLGENSLSGWSERLSSVTALINAGQYYPDRAYMGRLRREGRELAPSSHPRWKGFLISGPAPAVLLDLQNSFGPADLGDWQNIMQSFMMLDKTGAIRVRDSRNLAGRSAIGQDLEGRIVLIMTPAAVSLYDLALALQEPELKLVQVLGLDGGFESQLFLRWEGGFFLAGSQYSISGQRAIRLPGYYASLPAVLAVEPLGSSSLGFKKIPEKPESQTQAQDAEGLVGENKTNAEANFEKTQIGRQLPAENSKGGGDNIAEDQSGSSFGHRKVGTLD